MITDVVIVPGAPLLLPEYQGRVPAAPGLHESCVAAVREAVATAAHVVVVHSTDREPRGTRPALGLRVADHLLTETLVGFSVEHVAVPWDAPVAACVAAGRDVAERASAERTVAERTLAERTLAAPAVGAAPRGVFAPAHDAKTPPFAAGDDAGAGAAGHDAKGGVFASGGDAKTRRTTVMVVADGSARRTEKAPGHLDPRSHEVDDAIVDAIRSASDGGLGRLLELDADLCADLLVAGRAPLHVLAAAVEQAGSKDAFDVVSCEVSDPFGVLYVVAHLARPS